MVQTLRYTANYLLFHEQCKKLTKQETKLAIEEFGNKVEEARAKMVEDHTAGTRAKQVKETFS